MPAERLGMAEAMEERLLSSVLRRVEPERKVSAVEIRHVCVCVTFVDSKSQMSNLHLHPSRRSLSL